VWEEGALDGDRVVALDQFWQTLEHEGALLFECIMHLLRSPDIFYLFIMIYYYNTVDVDRFTCFYDDSMNPISHNVTIW